MTDLHTSKYENAILYLCAAMPNATIHGIKKMAKLLYYLDFDRFERNESMETITGDVYKRLPRGPYPENLKKITQGMVDAGTLHIEEIQQFEGYNKTTVYTALTEPDLNVFNADDLTILDRVKRLYAGLTGKQLEDQSHEEAPWLAVNHRDVIPFELAFYRDTDFADAA